ncbi:MAG TPA: transposase [Methylomirabilota bacterium]|nr:transposase [Methylomirabilota bacterium]
MASDKTHVTPSPYAAILVRRIHSPDFFHERSTPLSTRETFARLFAWYLGGISKTLECLPIIVGGVEDHVHLLCRFGRTITQADWVKELKRVSNGWLKDQGGDYADFEWQNGYASFSVSQSNLEKVKRYIATQEEHHRKATFQDELRALLRKHGLEFDERYVWG